ncbi:MAG: hypothetical protein Q7J54_04845 [Candidatus Woesearchaeota archaeon]|nr:hypothetical protein [Candidatus Woesearchaeota archaeon]
MQLKLRITLSLFLLVNVLLLSGCNSSQFPIEFEERISWAPNVTIFYATQDGLYSIQADRTNSKKIFDGLVDHFMLDPAKHQIAIHLGKQIYITNENGTETSSVFQTKGEKIRLSRFSPDGDWLFVISTETDSNYNPKLLHSIDGQINGLDQPYFYIVDLNTNQVTELKELEDISRFSAAVGVNAYFYKEGKKVLVYGSRIFSENDGRDLFFEYDFSFEKAVLICSYAQKKPWEEGYVDDPFESCINNASLSLYQRDFTSGMGDGYESSNDYKKVIFINEGSIKMSSYAPAAIEHDLSAKMKKMYANPNYTETIIQWRGDRYSGYSDPTWLPDDRHILVYLPIGHIFIVDTETKKIARLVDGGDAKYFMKGRGL